MFLFFLMNDWQIAINIFKNNLILWYFNFIKNKLKILNVKKYQIKRCFFSKPVDGDVRENIVLS